MEDLTGGVTTKIKTNRILSKERLWRELKQVRSTSWNVFMATNGSRSTRSSSFLLLRLGLMEMIQMLDRVLR